MQKNILMLTFLFPAFAVVKAQDSTKSSSLKFSGSADVYYRYDLNRPKSEPFNNFTSFTHSQNSFELGMISLKAEQQLGKAGVVAELGFGKRAEEFSYNDKSTSVAISQLYVTYSPSTALKFSLGSWSTHIGYELLNPASNKNYSMSYMFSYGPFFHTGIKGEVALSSKTTIMVGIANPSDLKSADNFPKMIIAQLATTSIDEKLSAYLNYQGGKNSDSGRLYQADIVLNYLLSGKFSLGYNGSIQARQLGNSGKWQNAKSWWGSAVYATYNRSELLTFSLRAEYFNDSKNVAGLNTRVFETTFSTGFKIDNLMIIPEIRFENAASKIYLQSNDQPVNFTANILLAAVYQF
jgi:hypothetical protein